MVELPTPTRVIIFPTIVATAGFELVYVIKPLPVVVGATTAKGAAPMILLAIEKLLKTVVLGFTTMVPVTVLGP
jgi:hypothetical protein